MTTEQTLKTKQNTPLQYGIGHMHTLPFKRERN